MTTARAAGFTLMEVLVAIALAAVLLVAMFSFHFDMLRARTRTIEHTARHRAAATLIERLESDLMTCVVGDGTSGAGVRGDESSLRVLTRAVPVALAATSRTPGRAFADLELAEYRFNEQQRVIEGRRTLLPAGSSRRDRARFAPFGGEIYKVRFRFHDGTQWTDSFDSLEADVLPAAVEVAVWFDPWPGAEDDAADQPADDPALAPLERATFDAGAGFDENAFAELSDLELTADPAPDRVRVIVIPDAAADDADGEAPS